MKKLLILLFSIFFLSSPSVFADDISDFKIEGISIGDSLLDYMTEDEILKQIEKNKDNYYYLNEPNKYVDVYIFKDFPTYEKMSFFIINIFEEQYVGNTNEKYIIPAIRESILKNNATNEYLTNKNEKYTILFIRGMIDYIEDFDSCIVKRDEIVEVLSEMFPNAQKIEDVWTDVIDPSGNSIFDDVTFMFDSEDRIAARCNDWDETYRIENQYSEGLHIAIETKEIYEWSSSY